MEKLLSLVLFRVQLANKTAGPIPKMRRSIDCFDLAAGTGLHTRGIADGPILYQGQGIVGFLLNDTRERRVLWAKPCDRGRGYALRGDLDYIFRIVGSKKLPCERKRIVTEDRELGP